MTKKHFKAIAEKVNRLRTTCVDENGKIPFGMVQALLFEVCAESNPLFDGKRFDDACNGRPYRK
jgi:hypothetical protein